MTYPLVRWFAATALFLILLGAPGPDVALAQGNAGAAILQIPTDVRSEGMGRGIMAINPEVQGLWGNVAVVTADKGIQVAGMKAQLVPDLADDVQMSWAGGRLSFSVGSLLLGIAGQYGKVDYGESPFDPEGETPTEKYTGGAVGLRLPLGSRWGLSLGAGLKQIEIDFGELGPGEDLADEVTAWDAGFLLTGLLGGSDSNTAWTWRTGVALHNVGDDINLIDFGEGDPLPKYLNVSSGVSKNFGRLPGVADDTVSRVFEPEYLARFTAAATLQHFMVDDDAPFDTLFGDENLSWYEENDVTLNGGAEVVFLDALAVRGGYVFDDTGEIKNFTWGFGLRLHGLAGIDYASTPQFEELQRVDKWSIWLRVPLQ